MEVEVGKHISLGRVKIRRSHKRLKFEDGYTNGECVVSPNSRVELTPLPPFHVPSKVADYLMIELETPIIVKEEVEFWLEGPYEIDVKVDGKRVAVLSPLVVKYTLYGGISDGTLCRYYRSPIYEGPPEKPEVAAILVRARSAAPSPLSSLVMHGSALTIFEKDGKYYYDIVEANLGGSTVSVTITDQPPVEGAVKAYKDPNILKMKFLMRL